MDALSYVEKIDQLNAEIERLRAALEEICRGTGMRAGTGNAWAFGVARRALEQKLPIGGEER